MYTLERRLRASPAPSSVGNRNHVPKTHHVIGQPSPMAVRCLSHTISRTNDSFGNQYTLDCWNCKQVANLFVVYSCYDTEWNADGTSSIASERSRDICSQLSRGSRPRQRRIWNRVRWHSPSRRSSGRHQTRSKIFSHSVGPSKFFFSSIFRFFFYLYLSVI